MKDKTKIMKTEEEQTFEYRLLSRLQSDCLYFLGYGNRSVYSLWMGGVEDQIEKMKELYNSLTVKPKWLSMDDILEFEKQMTQ